VSDYSNCCFTSAPQYPTQRPQRQWASPLCIHHWLPASAHLQGLGAGCIYRRLPKDAKGYRRLPKADIRCNYRRLLLRYTEMFIYVTLKGLPENRQTPRSMPQDAAHVLYVNVRMKAYCLVCSVSFCFWATICKMVRPMLSVHCLSVCPVCL